MVLVDAHNFIKRNYHGGGNPYGLFYNMLISNTNEQVVLVCDGPKSREHRKSIHPGYKAGRNSGEDPVYWEVYNNCKDMAALLPNVKVLEMTAGEADDYIREIASEGDTVISNDKDLWPLLDRDVKILLNASTKVDRDLVEVKFSCVPKHIDLYKALVGDPSDKIPGKRGFGPAAWAKLNFDDRELYSHHFETENCSYDPTIMTESACMSWKLAKPYKEFTYEVLPNKEGDVLEFCTEKGIML
jgi:DNA polymerase-1